jgi:hypothetical protein
MKKQIIMSLIIALPVAAIAQPALTQAKGFYAEALVNTPTYVTPETLHMYGAVNNNILMLRGDLKQGRKYAIKVYNLSGQDIYRSDFMGQDNVAAIDLYRNIEPGLYVVKLQETETANTAILKLSVQ